jgi:catechol 2,3-dioxygenase-like lactoylglutathione lyase family enzyme
MKIACLMLSLVAPIALRAESPAPAAIHATGAFLALSVADLDASTRWYVERLGLEVVQRPPKYDKSMAVVLQGAGLLVELIKHDDSIPLRTAAPAVGSNLLVHGIVKAGAIVDDFESLLAVIRARNVPIAFGPYPARADQRANVIIQDNDGNLIQFFGQALVQEKSVR